jgi:antitoxin (DNA-binding transcriptional repressor) of toxin-antitoxin stability system
MILVEMTEAPASVKDWVARARKVPVVLTIKGRPVAAVTPLDEGDWERLVVSCHPAFRRILEQSRERCRPGQGISTEEMRRRLKQRRAAAAAGPSGHRRAPRPARRARPSMAR